MADSIDVIDELNEKKKDLDKLEHDKEVLTKYSALLGIPQHDHGNFKNGMRRSLLRCRIR